jgi:hypothetical protein
MIEPLLTLLLALAAADVSPEATGTIQGVVVNGSRGNEAIEGADVLLRAGQKGDLEPAAQTKTDKDGTFIFEQLPLDPTLVFLPGTDRVGVHYPGKRLHLDQANPNARVVLQAFDAIEAPSPLVALRHEIEVAVEPKVMLVCETMLVANQSHGTYVGEAVGKELAVTLRLSVPPNFDRVTFGSEFYGRRFRIVDHQLVTDIPWPPGERELNFTYRIPLESSGGLFRRPLDMPCNKVSLHVRGTDAKKVSCNLPRTRQAGNETDFASADQQLPAGHALELQIGKLPFPWALYARWSALAVLGTLVVGTVAIGHLRKRRSLEPREGAIQGNRINSDRKRSRRVA